MEILLWWVPPLVVTTVAMVWVGWLARARDVGPDRSEAAQARFAAAITKELPARVVTRAPAARRDRSTGIAVRPSQKPAQEPAQEPVRHAVPHEDEGDRRSA